MTGGGHGAGGHGSGHSSVRGRQRKLGHGEEHENHERWLVTYADMLTLLFVLFVVLYAMGALNTSKFNQLKSSLAAAFNNGQQSLLVGGSGIVGGESQSQQAQQMTPTIPRLTIPLERPAPAPEAADVAAARLEIDQFKKIKAAINRSLTPRGLSGVARYSIDERGLVVTIVTDNLVFAGNSAVLEHGGEVIMDAVIPPLRGIDNQLQVDGHTNQANVSTDPYPSGWELSSARASSVVRYMVSRGLGANRLSAVGFSDQRPLVSPSDPTSVTRNRRVDIVVLSKLNAAARSQLGALGASVSGS
jgi:chemotaxis protein MotB